jgi:hypothetical protein
VEPRLAAVVPVVTGVTCVWDVSRDFWTVGEDTFGPVPLNTTFFELYRPDPAGGPRAPLEPISGFTSVHPVEQGSVIDVETFATQSGQTVVDFKTQGTYGGPSDFDVSIRSGELSDGAQTLAFDIDLSPLLVQTQARAQDIIVDETFALGTTDGSLILTVQKSGSGAQTIVFTLNFALQFPFPISSGDVKIDGATVATIGGTEISQPVITLTSNSPLPLSERPLLGDIFGDGETLTDGIFDLLLFGGCVGSEDATFCDSLGSS